MQLGEHIETFGGGFRHISRHLGLLVFFFVLMLISPERPDESWWERWSFFVGFCAVFTAVIYLLGRLHKLDVYENGLVGRSHFSLKSKLLWEDIERIGEYRHRSLRQIVFRTNKPKRDIEIDHSIFIEERFQEILRDQVPDLMREYEEK